MMLLGNLPPSGHGVYARGQAVAWLARFDFIALNADRGDAESKAHALISAGREVWFYRMPSSWMPASDFAAAVARDEELVKATGAAGAIADPENGWRGATFAQAAALAAALEASIKRGFRWGVTCFPDGIKGQWMKVLSRCGAWGTPQLYRPVDVRFYDDWTAAFGARMCVPSVALWTTPQDFYFTPENYAPYLQSMPATRGAIGWTTDQSPDSLVNPYLAWKPERNPLVGAALFLGAYGATPLGIAAIVLLALLVVAALTLR